MQKRINKVAVLGAGTMGARISAHLANAGVPSYLFDIVPPDADGPARNRFAAAGDMAGIAFYVLMDTGVMVEAMPFWRDEFDRPETFNNPALIRNILREGIRF